MTITRSVVNDLVLSIFSKYGNFRHRDPHTMKMFVEETLIKHQIPNQSEITRLGKKKFCRPNVFLNDRSNSSSLGKSKK